MISLKDSYVGRTDNTDTGYPYGKGINIQAGVKGTGTPYEAAWFNNLEGFMQALLKESGISPSGTPDTANVSQLLKAVRFQVDVRFLERMGKEFVGYFSEGFTITSANQIAVADDNTYWEYSGILPNEVYRGTDPYVTPDWTLFVDEYNAAKDFADDAAQSAIDAENAATSSADQVRTELQDIADQAQASADVALASVDTSSAIYDEVNDIVTGEGVLSGATSVHKAMRRCTLLDDGTVNYYLDANNSNLKFDGTASDLTGADGQVMVEVPKCYVKAVYLQGGASPIIEWSVSANPRQGYVLHPAFIKDGDLVYNTQLGMWNYENYSKVVDYIYVGAYTASVFDASESEYIDGLNLDDNSSRVDTSTDKLASVSGKYPMVGLTRSQFRSIAENRGAGWQQSDFWAQSLLQLLYTTEYRNLNSQAAIGNGTVSVSGGYPPTSEIQADSPHTIAGKSNAVGNATGGVDSSTRDVSWMSYRGVEHFWGNCYQWCDGINILDQVAFVNNTSTYTDNTTSSGYSQLGAAAPSANGYIRKVQSDTLSYLPLESTGGSTTGFCDYYYQSTGYRVLALGGVASDGALAGAFFWLGAYSSGNRARRIGGRLVFREII